VPYLTPPALPESDDCRSLSIPADTAWLALFGGALTELLFLWNWEQSDGGLTPSETVAEMQRIIDTWYESACGCELPEGVPLIRMGENYRFEELVDGTWQPATGDYYIPPPEARDDPTSEERRCQAARNAEYVLRQLYEEITDVYGTGLGNLEAIAEIAIFLAGLVIPALGLAYRALALAAIGIWGLAFDTAEFVTADFWTSAFTEAVICILYNRSTDNAGVVTFDFQAVNDDLITQINILDPTLGSFALAGQVRWMMSQLGEDGLNLAGGTTEIDNPDCSVCDGEWVYEWLFTESDGGWATRSVDEGEWVDGVGWVTTCASGSANRVVIYKNIPAIDGGMDRFESLTNYLAGSVPAGEARQIVNIEWSNANGAGSQLLTANAGTPPPNGEVEVAIEDNAAPESIMVNVWTSNGICDGEAAIQRVKVFGNGARPALTGGRFL